MSFFATLKANAKRALRNNWGSAAVVQLIPFFLSLFVMLLALLFGVNLPPSLYEGGSVFPQDGSFSMADVVLLMNAMAPMFIGMAVTALFGFLVMGPVLLGVTYWHTQITYGKNEPASKVFHFFENPKRYFRALGFNFQIAVRQLFWSILFLIIPTAILSFGIFYLDYVAMTNRMRAAILMGSVVLFLIVLGLSLLFAAYMNKYFLAVYKLADDDETPIRQLIKASIEESKRFRFSLVWFELSFIGWIFLSTAFFPLIFYVGPYMNTSMAMYARYIMETKRREHPTIITDIANETATPSSYD